MKWDRAMPRVRASLFILRPKYLKQNIIRRPNRET